jgi:hypothetical protein
MSVVAPEPVTAVSAGRSAPAAEQRRNVWLLGHGWPSALSAAVALVAAPIPGSSARHPARTA